MNDGSCAVLQLAVKELSVSSIVIASLGLFTCIAVEECLKWATQRKAFGKPLISLAVVRSKLAGMIERAESTLILPLLGPF